MEILTFIITWLFATTSMTLFSYIVYLVSHCEVREPELLGRVLKSQKPITKKKFNSNLLGWITHYSIGIIFLLFYEAIWFFTNFERTYANGFLFGILAGLIGVLGWKLMFKYFSRPKINFKVFYTQLIIAHITFSLTAILTDKILTSYF